MIEIWAPRYHDKMVLIAKYKVHPGPNKIVFTKAKHLKGMVFTMLGEDIAQYPTDTNGSIECYKVPINKVTEVKVAN